MRLAGLSDQVILAVARRRAAGKPVLSGPSLTQLKNAGWNEAELLSLIDRGATDDPDGPRGAGAAYWPEVARLLQESYRSLKAALDSTPASASQSANGTRRGDTG